MTLDKKGRDRMAAQKRAVVDQVKSGPCTDCGDTFPIYVMEFDHVPERGPKRWNIGAVIAQPRSMTTLLAELAKCDLVCANCHRIRAHKRGQHIGTNGSWGESCK
jgi:hypothetical protein